MRQPTYVATLSPAEQHALTAALRSNDAFTLRRAQILLASAQGNKPAAIAARYGCTDQTVRNAIHDFQRRGTAALKARSTARHDQQPIFDAAGLAALRDLLHHSPRDFGKATSLWTLALAAEVACAQKLTPYRVSDETIRQALHRLNVGWKRAKHWITSPDPAYEAKKNGSSG